MMRLDEIFGSDVKISNLDKLPARHDIVGNGYYATVYIADPHNWHEVVKVSFKDDKYADPYQEFVMKLVQTPELAEDNLYLPRVYEVHTSPHQTEIQLERLEPYNLLTFPEVWVWGEQTFTYEDENGKPIDMEDKFAKQGSDYTLEIVIPAIRQMAKDDTDVAVVKYFTTGLKVKVKCQDQKLLDALAEWRGVLEQNSNARWDVSANNIMWRRISIGLHPVFTDLLAPKN